VRELTVGHDEDRVIGFFRRVGERGTDVVSLKVWIVGKDVRLANAGREQVEHILDANTHTADARPPAALVGVECDAIHGSKLSFL